MNRGGTQLPQSFESIYGGVNVTDNKNDKHSQILNEPNVYTDNERCLSILTAMPWEQVDITCEKKHF